MLIISLLGEQAVIDSATGQTRSRSARTVALVAYLATHAGVPQSRHRIASLFWPDSTDAQALTNLRRELHHLRHTLSGDESLTVTSTDLCWQDSPTCEVDLRVFLREVQDAKAMTEVNSDAVVRHGQLALAAYGGELLPGMYDDWVLEQREKLSGTCVQLCDLISLTASGIGQRRVAVEAAKQRVRLRPLDESGYRNLMERQAELGNRAGAISTYHHCASVLEQELGVEPDPATTQVLNRLLRADRPPNEHAHAQAETKLERARPAAVGLVGRAAELGVLRSMWSSAQEGHALVGAVTGDPGVGKTRLITELAHFARREGAVVATSQCFDTSGRLSFAPVADWLRDPAIRAATARLDRVWQVEVERLLPDPGGHRGPSEPTRPAVMADAWQRHRFLEGLARAALAVSRPTMLVLDNLQWCDEETMGFLSLLLNLSADTPLMLALTMRTSSQSELPQAADWLHRLRASDILTEIPLSPLNVAETAELAGSMSGRPLADSEATLLQAATGGFALYVVEAARSADPRPASDPAVADGLTAVLRRRLEQSSPAARSVAGLAAALHQNFDLSLLVEASDLDEDSVVRAVDELWRSRIVREFKDGYDFSHDLLRDAAYSQVSPPRRWLLHRRLAQGLELIHSGRTDPVAALLAEQYHRAGNDERALAFYRRAADVAAALYGHAESIKHQRSALAIVRKLPPGRDRDAIELQCLAAIAPPINALYGYAAPALQEAFEHAARLAEGIADKQAMVTGMVGLWASRFVQGRMREAHDLAERLVHLVGPDDTRYGQAHFSFGGSAMHLGAPAHAVEHFDIAISAVGDTSLSVGTRASVHARAWSAHALWLRGDHADAVRRCERAITDARATSHPYTLAVALAYAAITYQLLGNRQALRETVTELGSLCERYDFAYYAEWGMVLGGWLSGGEDGVVLIERGIGRLRRQGAFARMPYWLGLLADATAPDASAARATLDAALAASHAREDLWWTPELMRRRAVLDPPEMAAERLRSACALAARQESTTLRDRCQQDLERQLLSVRANVTSDER